MGTPITAAWIDAGEDAQPKYSAEEYRALFSLFFKPGPRPLTAAPGIIQGLDVKADGSTITVAPGACIVTSASLGSFVCAVMSQARLRVAAPHSTYPRKDLLVVQVKPTGSGRGAMIELIEGTASAQAIPPVAPLHSLTLGVVTVPQRGAISIAPSRTLTNLAGMHSKTDVSLARGAARGSVGYVGNNQRADIEISVRTSGNAQVLASGIPESLKGSGILADNKGDLWPITVASGQVRTSTVVPSQRYIVGVIPVFNG